MMTKEISFGEVESELAKILGCSNPTYDEGKSLGSKGREPPLDLNRVTRPKQRRREEPIIKLFDEPFFKKDLYRDFSILGEKVPQVETEVDPARASFRQGYLEGLGGFMSQRGITFSQTGIFRDVNAILSNDDGLVGFVRGAKLEAPSIPREYVRHSKKDKFMIFESDPEWVRKARFKKGLTREGYKVGLVVGVARDYGVLVNGIHVPMDNSSYQSFKQGLEAQPRNLPIERRREDKKFFLEYDDVDTEVRALQFFDDGAYDLGLQVWLASQGATGVQTWQIRHPTALGAFKAALSGEVLTEYEPKPVRPSYD